MRVLNAMARVSSPRVEFGGPADNRWQGLRTLIRVRLLVATLALPAGVLLRPGAGEGAWWVMWFSLIGIGALSVLFELLVKSRRAPALQTYLQLAADLALVTAVAAETGGRESQFVLFFALVVISGGVLARLRGGMFAAAGACLAFLSLPEVMTLLRAPRWEEPVGVLPRPELLMTFLVMVGVLSGILGERVQRTRDDLERTARELDRVRVDNDAILRHLASGVLTVDENGRVAYLNPAAEQLLELRALATRGTAIQSALPARLASLRDLVSDTLTQHRPRTRVELLMRTALSRGLPLGVSTNLLMHEGQITGVVAVFQDLTEVREMERRARRNQTLAEVGALAAGIAHELRNGLKPISGSVECLQRELNLSGENAVLMQLIATESARLNKFVADLLSYSRERDLALETLELDSHLAELCDAVVHDPRRPAGVKVRFERGDPSAAVRLDRDQMRQVWLNLATNAFEAMPDGGTLEVRWRAGEGEQAVVEFVDNGPGIAAQDLPRVGQPFFTTKQGGTGLGLAIAQRIVERHGGTLSLESVPGRETIARVTLPGVLVGTALAA